MKYLFLILIYIPISTLSNVDNEYFHPAASAFIQGDVHTASNKITKGLVEYPDNLKLRRLEKLLEQNEQDQQNQQDQQNEQEQQNETEQQKKTEHLTKSTKKIKLQNKKQQPKSKRKKTQTK